MKGPAQRTKVVLRRLPPAIAQQAVVDQVDARFAGRYDWACFRAGNASQKNHRYSRLYLNFKSPEDVVEFADFFNGHVFVNEKGAQFKALVEYAPSQQVPKSNIKKDARQGTIAKDPEYLEFLELISKPTEHLPSAEIQLERKEAERAAAGKEPPVVTPLMVYVRQQRAAKSMAQRSVSSRLSRKVAGVVTSSSSPSKRASERRRASTSSYVVRENAKEKPTYILAPKRDDHTREKIIAGTSDGTSGGPSGSAQVVDGKRDKIVLLKGRARVDSNISDSSTPQQSVPPSRNTPPSSSRQDQRHEASGRIIKTILSNKEGRHGIASQHEQDGHMINADKDKRPPRVPNSRSIVKDQTVENAEKSYYDDKHIHLHSSGPNSEKIERHARNRDRPDRGVWAPRRYDKSASGGGTQASSSEFPLIQSHPEDNFSQQADGHGDRKIDTRSPGGRGGVVENGNRHANRRGPQRGLKEMEISPITSDGKPSKRGAASYGAHERQVWVQKSSSAFYTHKHSLPINSSSLLQNLTRVLHQQQQDGSLRCRRRHRRAPGRHRRRSGPYAGAQDGPAPRAAGEVPGHRAGPGRHATYRRVAVVIPDGLSPCPAHGDPDRRSLVRDDPLRGLRHARGRSHRRHPRQLRHVQLRRQLRRRRRCSRRCRHRVLDGSMVGGRIVGVIVDHSIFDLPPPPLFILLVLVLDSLFLS